MSIEVGSSVILSLIFSLSRIEHEAFTAKNLEGYRQLVRVVVTDFLPFVKTAFESLYSLEKVSRLALTGSAYALRHQVASGKSGLISSSVQSGSRCLDLKMGLDLQDIAGPLQLVAPEVFQELEAIAEKERLAQDMMTVGSGLSVEEELTVKKEEESVKEGVATEEAHVAGGGSDYELPQMSDVHLEDSNDKLSLTGQTGSGDVASQVVHAV